MNVVKPPIEGLSRLGLGHAALKAAILSELDQIVKTGIRRLKNA